MNKRIPRAKDFSEKALVVAEIKSLERSILIAAVEQMKIRRVIVFVTSRNTSVVIIGPICPLK